MKLEAIVFVGIPGSGKSVFFSQKFIDTHIRINLDMLKTRNREKILIEACFNAKQSFVVDNTNVKIADREKYILSAKKYGFSPVCYFFKSSLKDCLLRNAQRAMNKIIPEPGIISKFKNLELPSYKEDFEKIYCVSILGNNQFKVEDWQDEIR
ncbi:MAG: AAA family ATPase [Candidatus Riflebacteria bacterium]|nr:AAA family ATPase [Candidatus Riflebacteria bacterium]